MPNTRIKDLTIYYEISGDGPPLVLLPGLLDTVESDWRRFIPILAKSYRTIAVDFRGHGRTDNPSPSGDTPGDEMHISQLAEDVGGLLDYLGDESVSLLGYSLGGCVGLKIGLEQPGRIKALIMHATKFFWDEASVNTMAANMNPDTILEKSPRYAQTLQRNHAAVYGNDYWQSLVRTAARFVKTMPTEAPNLEQAKKASFPILVSVGDHDQLISLEEATRLFRSLPQGELLVLPATRHPFQTVRPETFLPVTLNFLERALKPQTA